MLSSEKSNDANDLCGFIEAKIQKKMIARMQKYQLETQTLQQEIQERLSHISETQTRELTELQEIYERERKQISLAKKQQAVAIRAIEQEVKAIAQEFSAKMKEAVQVALSCFGRAVEGSLHMAPTSTRRHLTFKTDYKQALDSPSNLSSAEEDGLL